jgi:hypothetical protein
MSHAVEEVYEVYSERTRTAAYPHVCDACEDRVQLGAIYTRVVIVQDGEVTTLRRCHRCQTIHEHLRLLCADQERWPDEQLMCGEDYEEEWGKLPPEIAALAFALPGRTVSASNPR